MAVRVASSPARSMASASEEGDPFPLESGSVVDGMAPEEGMAQHIRGSGESHSLCAGAYLLPPPGRFL
jgi:hypothetical protein